MTNLEIQKAMLDAAVTIAVEVEDAATVAIQKEMREAGLSGSYEDEFDDDEDDDDDDEVHVDPLVPSPGAVVNSQDVAALRAVMEALEKPLAQHLRDVAATIKYAEQNKDAIVRAIVVAR